LASSYTLTKTTTVLWPSVWDYPGEPVPEETLTHPPSWTSSSLYWSASSICYDPWHPPCSNYVLGIFCTTSGK